MLLPTTRDPSSASRSDYHIKDDKYRFGLPSGGRCPLASEENRSLLVEGNLESDSFMQCFNATILQPPAMRMARFGCIRMCPVLSIETEATLFVLILFQIARKGVACVL